ncbi:MAG: FHA domain-containing protein [Isosphaeraceae bacterium]
MATFEVHDAEGRVERVTVSRDQTVMFGSSPKCDIVLAGPSIVPFHGRIRWREQKGKFKVDASPDGRFVLVNGHKMSSSSLNTGDEIEVGGYRIFLVSTADPVPADPTLAPREAVTRVLQPEFLAPPKPGTVIRRGERPAPKPEPRRPAAFEKELDAVVTALDRDDDPQESVSPIASELSRPDPKRTPTGPPRRGWKRLFYLFSKRAATPGREEVLSSPLVFSLAIAFVCLILTGVAAHARRDLEDRDRPPLHAGRREPRRRRLPDAIQRLRRVPRLKPGRPPRGEGEGPPCDGQRPTVRRRCRRVLVARARGRE